MARRLFFVSQVRGGRAGLNGDEARHLRRVLRAEIGQKYEVSDGGSLYLAEIEGFGKESVSFRILEPLEPRRYPVRLTILAALIKFDRLEWLIEKATELGVERVVPVETERSEKGLERAACKRLERWRRIAFESSQQSRRVSVPEVVPPLTFEAALEQEGEYRLCLDEANGLPPILSALPEVRCASDRVLLLCGPEGGWVDRERESADRAGWKRVSLGPQILRAETAAIAGLSVISSAWQMPVE
jgi:RNA methyltransferase, RsmE family